MDTTDVYAHRRLLYKCDASISKIYNNVFKMLLDPDTVPEEALRSETVK